MKNTIIASFLLLMSTTVFAQGKYYLSYEVSDNKWDIGVTVVSGATLDEDDTGYAILGGIHLNDNLDLEFGYKDFGEAYLAGASGNTFRLDGTLYAFNTSAIIVAEGEAYLIGLKPKHDLTENISIFAKIGVNMWDTTYHLATGTASGSVDDDGTDFYYGVGVSASFAGLDIGLSHSIYEFDSDDVESTALSLSYTLNF